MSTSSSLALTGAPVMSTGNMPSGHQCSSLMSLGLPYILATARNGCTGFLESDLLTLTSISVMVWGAFSFSDRTPFYVIEVIQPFVIPALKRTGAAAMFQDDNA